MEVVFNRVGSPKEASSIFIAVPSNGNAGQMAADALCSSISGFQKVGVILSEYLVPMTGYDDFGGERGVELCSPCDIYQDSGTSFVVIIQRSACRLGMQRVFYQSLSDVLTSAFEKCTTISILTGAGLETVFNPSEQRLFFIPPLSNSAMIQMQTQERLSGLMRAVEGMESVPGYLLIGASGGHAEQWAGKIDEAATVAHLQKSNPLLDSVFDYSTTMHVNAEKPVGMGGAALLYNFLSSSTNSEPVVATSIIGTFVYEGDNRDDGIQLAKILVEAITPEDSSANKQICTPASWRAIGGGESRESRAFPAVI